jgi:hypothetical protein
MVTPAKVLVNKPIISLNEPYITIRKSWSQLISDMSCFSRITTLQLTHVRDQIQDFRTLRLKKATIYLLFVNGLLCTTNDSNFVAIAQGHSSMVRYPSMI